MADRMWRSIARSVSYRIVCVISLSVVTYLFTRDIYQMTLIVIVFQTIQTGLYYLHERIWTKVRWGS